MNQTMLTVNVDEAKIPELLNATLFGAFLKWALEKIFKDFSDSRVGNVFMLPTLMSVGKKNCPPYLDFEGYFQEQERLKKIPT